MNTITVNTPTTSKNIRRAIRRSPRTIATSAAVAEGLAPHVVAYIGNVAEFSGTDSALEIVSAYAKGKASKGSNERGYALSVFGLKS